MTDRTSFSSRCCVVVVLASLFCFTASSRAAEPRVRWLSPTASQLLIDQVEAQLAFDAIDESQIASVQIALDGKVVASMTRPPWRASFDAGDRLGRRLLEAVVRFHTGQVLRQLLVVEPEGFVEEVDVPLVTLALAAKDRAGKPVRDLAREEVTVLDAGRPVTISQWQPDSGELAVAVVIDTSNSMKGERIDRAREAALLFLRQLDASDQVLLLEFNDEPYLVSTLTPVTDRLTTAIASLEARGGTALYDAVWRASELLAESQPDRRRVVVLLSDGRDESASGLEPGSLHTLQEAVRAAHLNDVTVYSIGLGRQLEVDLDFEGKSTTSEILSRISGSTGGTFTAVEKAGRLDAAFRGVVEELRNLYSIAYSMPMARPGETWRSISVRVARPGVNARAREGYFVR